MKDTGLTEVSIVVAIIVSVVVVPDVMITLVVSTDGGHHSLGFVVSLMHCNNLSALITVGMVSRIVSLSIASKIVVSVMVFERRSMSFVMSFVMGFVMSFVIFLGMGDNLRFVH